MTTGQLIRAARKRAKMTQAELAEKLGISYVGVSQWENGIRNPKYETMQKIADALEISLSELVGMNPAVDIPENREAFDKAAAMALESGLTMKDRQGNIIIQGNGKPWQKATAADLYHIGALQFHSDEDRIAFFYNCLNTDGMLAASKCFLDHLKSEDIKEVADYVEKLAQTPQYQRPQEADENKK